MLALFPLVFFFQFLYYTDLPCIVFVLATHLVGRVNCLHSSVLSQGLGDAFWVLLRPVSCQCWCG